MIFDTSLLEVFTQHWRTYFIHPTAPSWLGPGHADLARGLSPHLVTSTSPVPTCVGNNRRMAKPQEVALEGVISGVP